MFTPHPLCNRHFLAANSIGIDGGGSQGGVAQPAAEQIERHASEDTVDAKAVTQSLWAGVCACNLRVTTQGLDPAVARDPIQRLTLMGPQVV